MRIKQLAIGAVATLAAAGGAFIAAAPAHAVDVMGPFESQEECEAAAKELFEAKQIADGFCAPSMAENDTWVLWADEKVDSAPAGEPSENPAGTQQQEEVPGGTQEEAPGGTQEEETPGQNPA
ncbi:hypothetical protein HDA32_001878 [Spinactinospora alkalitolerans]|uniref:Uncharacterized protein n=1 Tax=Spinactinospora alkalitolerans TaxID=687207 RepID=A0A852TS32_9ACTN|nr:hypothetical protein [Spinactinospora alkalitolerans]NYE46758.1 hypothetical protein [Spinactinospora alkalitolerans]